MKSGGELVDRVLIQGERLNFNVAILDKLFVEAGSLEQDHALLCAETEPQQRRMSQSTS